MADVFVEDFRQRVGEILGYENIVIRPIFGGYELIWKTDNKKLRIQYRITRSATVIVDRYIYQESKPDYFAIAVNYGSYSIYEYIRGSQLSPEVKINLRLDEVPGIFKDEDAMFSFIEAVRDNGINAFYDLMLRLRFGQEK